MINNPLGNRDLIRALNRSTILNTIKANGVIPRSDIARLTGLSPATVTGITAELIQDDLVFEKESGDSSGGRRPIMLAINPGGGFAVGIKVMEDHVTGAMIDLESNLWGKLSLSLDGQSPENVGRAIVNLVSELLKIADISTQKLIGIGVGLAGIINSEQGIVRISPFFGWRDVPLRDLIQSHVNVPVYLDNDVNTLAFAEKWFGAGQGVSDFLVVTFGRGIGLGIVLNGQFYHGTRGGAGEFGHICVEPGGLPCTCGKQGCLEMYASEPALLLQAKELFLKGEISVNPQTPEELEALASAGEWAVQAIFTKAAKLLGQNIANLVNVFNPQSVLIVGEGLRAGHWLLDPMREAIAENTMPGLRQDTSIIIEPFGDDAWARGAASLVVHKLFESPIKQQPWDLQAGG